MSDTFAIEPATRLRRHPERASYQADAVHALLDSHWVCQIAFVHDGIPQVLPTTYWRDGDGLYIHGSNGSRMMKMLAAGDSCTNVCLVDGMVLARSAFSHSANYRSVNVYGRYVALDSAEAKQHALQRFFEVVLPGRWPLVRQPNAKEIAATTVLRLPIERAVLKSRSGAPIDDAEDAGWRCWAGVLPFAMLRGSAQPDAGIDGAPNPELMERWPSGR